MRSFDKSFLLALVCVLAPGVCLFASAEDAPADASARQFDGDPDSRAS